MEETSLTLGLTAAGVVSGMAYGISFLMMPSTMLAPRSVMLQQWNTMYLTGMKVVPSVGLFAAANLSYVAYSRYQRHHDSWKPIALAATGAAAFIPFTLIVMRGTNNALQAATASKVATVPDKEIMQMLSFWTKANTMRGTIVLLATLVGVWGSIM